MNEYIKYDGFILMLLCIWLVLLPAAAIRVHQRIGA